MTEKNKEPEKIGEIEVNENVEIKETIEAKGGAGMNPNYVLPASIIVAGLLVAGSIVYLVKSNNSPQNNGAANIQDQGQQAAGAAANALKLTSDDVVLGNSSAPVTFIEYGDYQCPFCGRFFTDVEPQIKTNYIDTGKVKFVFRGFSFLGPESTAAAEAVECAKEQGKFWQYHDAVYSAEVADGQENNGSMTRALFMKLASDVGLNASTFGSCLDSNKYADQVQQDNTNAKTAGVNSTPTSFINGQQILGALPYAQFASIIDNALKTK